MTTTAPARRSFRPGGPAARHELAIALASIWAAEAIRPSRHLVLAAVRLEEGPALDNTDGGFSGVEPGWGERIVRVSDMLLRSLAMGGEVWAFTRRQESGPNFFLARLRERAVGSGLESRLRTGEADVLPVMGFFGDGFSLAGAIAFTEGGPDFGAEGLVFELDPSEVRRAAALSTLGGQSK